VSLFGEASDIQIAEPIVPPCEEWSTMEKLAREKEVVGIYISGHPLDDYKFEMEYFCNVKLEQLKSLESLVGKTVSFGGIVTNIQHRTAKNGKGWATFLLEGYDESYEFRIFDEEYLKFRHFLVQNQFVYFKVLVKDGWVNRETGKKSDPRIQFMEAKMLADVLPTYAKKLIIILNIKELHQDFVYQLSQIMTQHQGDHSVTFEVLEIEKVKKEIEIQPVINEDTEEVMTDEIEGEMTTEITMNVTETIEENKVITAISMPSRKTKVKISSEFLNELEKLQVNFKLN
jgi:DNA polymerase-3 subunit alpha